MNCPPDVARVLLDVLRLAALEIRARGWQGDAAGCAVAADHIHNLPTLLGEFSDDLLRFYWDVERPEFVRRSKGADLSEYKSLWAELAELLPTRAR